MELNFYQRVFSVESGAHDWNKRKPSLWASCNGCWAWVPELPNHPIIQVNSKKNLYVSIFYFRNGEIDKVGMAVQFARMTGLMAGSNLSFKLAEAACGAGPLGIAVGAVACIGLAVADHFIFKEDEQEVLTREYKKLQKEVAKKAYSMFDLEEHCTDAELKSAYLESVRKYHTDRNSGDSGDVVKAVISAYTLLKTIRESS